MGELSRDARAIADPPFDGGITLDEICVGPSDQATQCGGCRAVRAEHDRPISVFAADSSNSARGQDADPIRFGLDIRVTIYRPKQRPDPAKQGEAENEIDPKNAGSCIRVRLKAMIVGAK